jgi:16S rRNA (guanine966-N2)-methyltransferase
MRLLGPRDLSSRPITDRVKESLFNILIKYDLPAGSAAADLFCGVGSLGLEALSRGAEFVRFVERDPKTVAVLEKNLARANFQGRWQISRMDAFGFSPVWRGFDLVFIDPPYAATADTAAGSPVGRLLANLGEKLDNGAVAVVRTRKTVRLLDSYGDIRLVERRPYGSTALAILMVEHK